MQRLIDFLLIVAIILLGALFVTVGVNAETDVALAKLRQTSVRVDGTACLGSGSVVQGKSGKRYILTNAHVCNCARWKGEIFATFEDGKLLTGKIAKSDWGSDLCAARIYGERPALKVGPTLAPLEEITTRGYPGGRLTESHGRVHGEVDWEFMMDIEMIGECPNVSKKAYGMNDKLNGCLFHYRSVITDLYARPGASGSPVVNDKGELVGVISSWLADNDYEGGMVPFSRVKEFLGSL